MSSTPQVSNTELLALIAKLQADNAALAAQAKASERKITFKVSEKTGALSVYGMNTKFPVTLYVQQWEKLLARKDDILAFAKANAATLTRKA